VAEAYGISRRPARAVLPSVARPSVHAPAAGSCWRGSLMVDAVISVQEEQRQRRLHFLVKTLRSQGAQDVTLSASQTSGMGAPMVAVSDELCFLTMTQAAALFASKTLTPTMLLHAIFDRIDRTEPTLNSFVCEMRSTAEVQAAVWEPRKH
jgi:hypothetical protein